MEFFPVTTQSYLVKCTSCQYQKRVYSWNKAWWNYNFAWNPCSCLFLRFINISFSNFDEQKHEAQSSSHACCFWIWSGKCHQLKSVAFNIVCVCEICVISIVKTYLENILNDVLWTVSCAGDSVLPDGLFSIEDIWELYLKVCSHLLEMRCSFQQMDGKFWETLLIFLNIKT